MFSENFTQYSSRMYAARLGSINAAAAEQIAAHSGEMRTALEYLYGTLPLDDIRFVPFAWLEEVCASAIAARAENRYKMDIPEDIFAQYVLCPRVNNERPQRYRHFLPGSSRSASAVSASWRPRSRQISGAVSR